jgi:hypothetical protein
VIRRHRLPDCIVLLELFVGLHEVVNPILEVVKHANLHCMEEVRVREVAHDRRYMSKHVQSSVNMAR